MERPHKKERKNWHLDGMMVLNPSSRQDYGQILEHETRCCGETLNFRRWDIYLKKKQAQTYLEHIEAFATHF